MAGLIAARRPAAGFTMVEILVVLGVVALLMAIIFPVVFKMREKAKTTACLAHLRTLGVGLNGYLGDHNLTMPTLAPGRVEGGPPVDTIDTVLATYVDSDSVFRCPADLDVWRATGTSYFWNPALNGQSAAALNFLDLTEAPTRIPVLSDKEGWHDSGGPRVNILYADGRATTGLQLTAGR